MYQLALDVCEETGKVYSDLADVSGLQVKKGLFALMNQILGRQLFSE